MKKKNYIPPKLQVVDIGSEGILAGSVLTGTASDYGTGNSMFGDEYGITGTASDYGMGNSMFGDEYNITGTASDYGMGSSMFGD